MTGQDEQLFFSRLRSHMRWAFVIVAAAIIVIFAVAAFR